MYSMGTLRDIHVAGCAFVSGVSGMFAERYSPAAGARADTDPHPRGIQLLGIMAPIANLLSVVYAVAAAAVLIINQRRL